MAVGLSIQVSTPERHANQKMTWRQVDRPDATIHYLDSGGAGAPAILLHGLAGHAGEWIRTMAHLFPRRRSLALDQRGHGRSTRRPEDLSREAFADDVAAVIEAAGLHRPVVLIGQSMGAHTAFFTAARYPHLVSHLVMIEGDVGGGGGLASLRDALTSWPLPFSDYEKAMAFFGGDSEAGRGWADGLESRPDGLWPRWDLEVMVRTMAPVLEREYWAEWESLPHPTLLVLGEAGEIDSGRVERMVATRPTTRLVTFARAGHDVHLQQSQAWLRALDDFLG